MVENIRSSITNDKLLQQRRKEIVDTAIKLFVRKGYTNTTIRDIARENNITTGGLYRYIGSKEDIIRLISEESEASIIQIKEMLNNQAGNGDIINYMRLCIRIYMKWNEEWSDRTMFYNREIYRFPHHYRKILLQSQKDYVDFFENLINRGIEEGIFYTKYPKLLAHNVVLLGHDWILRNWYLSRYFTADEYVAAQTDMIIQLLTHHDR